MNRSSQSQIITTFHSSLLSSPEFFINSNRVPLFFCWTEIPPNVGQKKFFREKGKTCFALNICTEANGAPNELLSFFLMLFGLMTLLILLPIFTFNFSSQNIPQSCDIHKLCPRIGIPSFLDLWKCNQNCFSRTHVFKRLATAFASLLL